MEALASDQQNSIGALSRGERFMANVKIFVSHRIDQKSVLLENSVYIPVRCGACFDQNPEPDSIGDDTGDNISDKREYLGEFTVQYWAWKNVEADYYGLCHYRRYLSFSQNKYPTDERNQVVEERLCQKAFRKFALDDPERIEKTVSKYDAVVADYAEIGRMFTPRGPKPTLREHFSAYDGYLVEKTDIKMLLDTLKELYPEIGESGESYFSGRKFLGYNCFILKKELFFELCEMETAVLRAISEKMEIDFQERSNLQTRAYGFFAEWLYGIFIYHIEWKRKAKVHHTQLVFFEETEAPKAPEPKPGYIPVAFLTSRYYWPMTQVAIRSLVQSKRPDTRYEFLLLHAELEKKDLERIDDEFPGDGCVMRFVNLKNLAPEASNGLFWNCTQKTTHGCYLLPWILKKYGRVVYLHSDLLVKSDLTELYQAKLDGCLLAAPRDSIRICENRQNRDTWKLRKYKLGMEEPFDFFSTSVMAMDLEAIRGKIFLDDCIRYTMGNYFCRDVANTIFRGRVKLLDACWNVCPAPGYEIEQLQIYMPKRYCDALKEAEKHPKVVHYPFYPKPWQNPFHPWAAEYWRTARTVPLYEQMLIHACTACMPAPPGLPPMAGPFPQPVKSRPRQIADVLLPKGSARREICKKICPKDSRPWKVLKRIYYFFFRR